MKKQTKKHALQIACVGICAAMLMTACGGNNTSSGSATGETGSTSTGTSSGSVSAPTGGGDGVLDVGYSQTLDSLTPFRQEGNRDAPFMNLVC